MSTTIDERVLSMKFENTQFLSRVKGTLDALSNLKTGLKLDGAKKGLDDLSAAGSRFTLGNIGQNVEHIAGKFTAMSAIALGALASIGARALQIGGQLVSSLTIDPLRSGLQEYETNLNAIQTILANTSAKGTTLDQVNGALETLNEYSDKTIYNFAEMARNIGTFTAAGVDLDTSTTAIKGIANLAAVSGSNSQQASTAMYQLSQALAAGKVSLMDWNSVVNAGMGGEVFQNALKETARAQGVAIDDIIAKNGSFRDSLQEGWLTSGVLTETLSKFTGDLTRDQILAMGYTEEQTTAIMAQATTAQDAATKVKTLSQLIGTLQEASGSGWAKSWQIALGDFEEAKTLFTGINNVLGKMIGDSADARNNLLQGWKDGGGRAMAIEAVTNAFNALMAILKPIKEAFQEVFPPMTAQNLIDITQAVLDFSKKLMPTGAALANLKDTAKGVFSIFKIGVSIIQAILGMFGKLFGAVGDGSGGFLEITGAIGRFLTKVQEAITNGTVLSGIFGALGAVLRVPIDLLMAIGKLIGSAFDGLANLDFSGFGAVLGAFGDRMSGVAGAIGEAWNWAGDQIQAFLTKIKPVTDKIGEFFSGVGDALADTFKNADYSLILDAVNTGLFAGLILMFKQFLGGGILKGLFGGGGDAGGGIIDTIKGVFGSLTDTMTTMQTNLKAKTLISIAIAIALLTASVVALSMIDSEKLSGALTAMSIMFATLMGSLSLMTKLITPLELAKMTAMGVGLILLSVAMGILAGAVTKLSELSWDELLRGLTGVGVMLGLLIGASKLMEKSVPGMIASSVGLVAMALAIKVLASAVGDFAEFNWDEIGRGLVGVGSILAALLIFNKLNTVNKGAIGSAVGLILLGAGLKVMASAVKDFASMDETSLTKGLISVGLILAALTAFSRTSGSGFNMALTAVGLLVISSAMKILASALEDFGGMSWEEIGRGLVAMAGALVLVVGAMALMDPKMLLSAVALTVVAYALGVLADSFGKMASMSWDEIGRGMVVLAGSLLILAGAMALMGIPIVLLGAVGILAAAAAMTVLAPALKLLGTMSWDDIGRGLTILAAGLVIIAAGGILLLPAIPGLLALGVAIGLMGIGLFAAGIGIGLFAAGLAALTAAGPGAAQALSDMFMTAINLIPQAMIQLGLGIIALAQVVTAGAPVIAAAIITVLSEMLNGINTIVPQIVVTFTNIVMALLLAIQTLGPEIINTMTVLILAVVEAIVILVPNFVDAGLRILTGVINGIANNIGKIIDAATNLVVNFLDGIGRNLPRVIQSGIELILSFVNGLANGIRNNTASMQAAGKNLAGAIIDGMTGGLASGVSRVINAAANVAGQALSAAKSLLGINSPSKEFFKLGEWSDEGMANGFTKHAGVVSAASASVGEGAMYAMKKSISGIANAVATDMDMTPTIRPVLDLSGVRKGASQIGGMMGASSISLETGQEKAMSISLIRRQQEEEALKLQATPANENSNVVFNQYNTSPKALSEGEIYRQSKNLLSAASKK
jgi:tape measure domain-containing protein